MQLIQLAKQLGDIGYPALRVLAVGTDGNLVATRRYANLELLLDETQRFIIVRCDGFDDFGIESDRLHGSGAPAGASCSRYPPSKIGGSGNLESRPPVPPVGLALPAFPPLTNPH